MRLCRATFLCRTHAQLRVVWFAFSCVYPSLKTLRPELLTRLLYADMAAEREIAAAIGEGKATVQMVDDTVQVAPGVGDRFMTLRRHEEGILVTCDYSHRPSERAARAVVRLAATASASGPQVIQIEEVRADGATAYVS